MPQPPPPTSLDRAVKGAAPDTPISTILPPALAASLHESKRPGATTSPPASPLLPNDPLSTLPSSPPQIYLNLLILEASLRAQHLALQARRRQHTFFLALLAAWIAWHAWAVFLRPREDGAGRGGSVYWVVDLGGRLALLGGVITAALVWATGQWDRGVRWPRRWVGTTNRGLRGMNLKLVVLRGPWWRRLLATAAFLLPIAPFLTTTGPSYRFIETPPLPPDRRVSKDPNTTTTATTAAPRRQHQQHQPRTPTAVGIDEDVSPGGDHVRLLLLPKAFSPGFRENWDLYRQEYWEHENERRAALRAALRSSDRERERARRQRRGWLWWTGWRGFVFRARAGTEAGKAAAAGSASKARPAMETERPHSSRGTHPHRDRGGLQERPRRRRDSQSHSYSSYSLTPPSPAQSELDESPRFGGSRRVVVKAAAAESGRGTSTSSRLARLGESNDGAASGDGLGLGLVHLVGSSSEALGRTG